MSSNTESRLEREHPLPTESSNCEEMPRKIVRRSLCKKADYPHRDKWCAWLQRRAVGESFIVGNYTLQYVRSIAKRCDIDIVNKRVGNTYKTRVWVYGKPGNRTPIYEYVTVTRKVVEEHIIHPRKEVT